MHNAEANEQIVKEFYHNMVTGDVDGALGLLDKYVIWSRTRCARRSAIWRRLQRTVRYYGHAQNRA